MIDLCYWPTPNGDRITMFLEEGGLAFRIVPIDISMGEQFKPELLAFSPNNRVPAIIDYSTSDAAAEFQKRAVVTDDNRKILSGQTAISGR